MKKFSSGFSLTNFFEMQCDFCKCDSGVKSKLIVLIIVFAVTKMLVLCQMLSARDDFVHSIAQICLVLKSPG